MLLDRRGSSLSSAMFACGDNEIGKLGLGDNTHRSTFTAVPALPDGKVAKQVVSGGDHTMILAEEKQQQQQQQQVQEIHQER